MKTKGLMIFIKWALCAGLSLFPLVAAASAAETVTVRLDFSRFNQAVLETPLTGRNYYDFELVDAHASIMHFQEFILKEKFPELRGYGTSAETVLAYTDANGLLYDGVESAVGRIADRADPNTVILYLWEGMRYLQWQQGGRAVQDSDVFVYKLLTENVHPDAPVSEPIQNDVLFGDIINTDMIVNEVYLNRESIFLSVRKGDLPTLFTQSIENVPSGGGLRLTLTAYQPESGLRLHYNRQALDKLSELSIQEICLADGEQETVYTMEQLRAEK